MSILYLGILGAVCRLRFTYNQVEKIIVPLIYRAFTLILYSSNWKNNGINILRPHVGLWLSGAEFVPCNQGDCKFESTSSYCIAALDKLLTHSCPAFVNSLVCCTWPSSGAWEVWRLWLQLGYHMAYLLQLQLRYHMAYLLLVILPA